MHSNFCDENHTYYLAHYGVPGMRWRVHRGRKRGAGSYDLYKRGTRWRVRSGRKRGAELSYDRYEHDIPAHSDRIRGRKIVTDDRHSSRGRQGLGSYRNQLTRTYGGYRKPGSGYGSDLRENDHYTSTRANRKSVAPSKSSNARGGNENWKGDYSRESFDKLKSTAVRRGLKNNLVVGDEDKHRAMLEAQSQPRKRRRGARR